MTIANSYNFKAITDAIGTAGVVGENRLKGLAAEGYQTVINLLPADNEHAVANEQQIVEAQGLNYIYIPVDFSAPSQQNLDDFFAAMDANQGRKLLIHCAANYRVSAFYGIYAVQQGGWTAEQACQHIHSLWNPADYPAWQRLLGEYGLRL